MSLIPTVEEDLQHDDLCWQCGCESADCICHESLPDDFDPLDEDGYDPDWDDYVDDLGPSPKDM